MRRFNLCAALNEDTRKLQDCSCCWDKVSAIARQQLETLTENPNINCNDPDLYRKQEMSDVPGGSYIGHVLTDYQQRLRFLDGIGTKRLEAAKHTNYIVERSDA